MILLLLIFSVVLILFCVLLDYIAKKKGYKYQAFEGSKSSSESEHIKQVHLNQAIGNGDSETP